MNTDPDNAALEQAILRAAELIRSADAILIGAGAGMGVDSGLPDFRGPEGFWKAYPAFQGRRFAEVSNPRWFAADPEMAWGFFGHRLGLYRSALPHAGFEILRRWSERALLGAFVFTSNVDGQFAKAGFSPERIVEIHGSIHYLQCTRPCRESGIWPTPDLEFEVDPATVRTRSPLPRCPRCEALARPNILMFGDGSWLDHRSGSQFDRFEAWLRGVGRSRLAVVELGAGNAVPTVRMTCEGYSSEVIRINPRDSDGPPGTVSIPLGAREGLERINRQLERG